MGTPRPGFRCRSIRATQPHERHQSEPVHDAPGDRRDLRRRCVDALDRDGRRHGDAGERRQRLRCRCRHCLDLASGRAASQRPRRRRAGDRVRHTPRQAGSDLRAGSGARRRHHRALSPRRSRTRARHRASCGLRPWHVRDLDAAAARLWQPVAARGSVAGHRLRAERLSAGRARQCDDRDRGRTLPHILADFGRGVFAEQHGAADRHAVHQSTAGSDVSAHPERSRERRRRSRRPDRAGARILVARVRSGSD